MDVAKVGDVVVCSCSGGPHRIITGARATLVDDKPVARVGDRTSCGATITTGLSWFEVEDAPVAIDGSTTSCGGHVLAASTAITGTPTSISLGPGMTFRQTDNAEAELEAEIAHINAESTARSPATATAAPTDDTASPSSDIAPGFHVVRQPGTRDQLKQRLFTTPTPAVEAMFERLNGHLADYVLPGSLVVLSDPDNPQCTAEEAALQDQARQVQVTVQQLEATQAQTMIDSWGALADLEHASQLAGNTSTQLGVAVSGLSRLTQTSSDMLDELARAYESGSTSLKAHGQVAFRRFDALARDWINQPFELPDAARDLKATIGVKMDQAVHTVQQAIEGAPEFRLPTVADAIRKASRWVKPLNYANYLAIGLDYTSTNLKVESACRQAATSEECRRIQFVEYGGLTGRTFGGWLGGGAGQACLALGITPASMTCAIAVSGAGAYGGMQVGDPSGKWLGELIYETIYDTQEADNGSP